MTKSHVVSRSERYGRLMTTSHVVSRSELHQRFVLVGWNFWKTAEHYDINNVTVAVKSDALFLQKEAVFWRCPLIFYTLMAQWHNGNTLMAQ